MKPPVLVDDYPLSSAAAAAASDRGRPTAFSSAAVRKPCAPLPTGTGTGTSSDLARKRRGQEQTSASDAATSERATETFDASSNNRVLVIDDDDASLRALLRTTLEALALEVEEADSAAQARAAILARHRDLIELEIELPDLDAVSFCRDPKPNTHTSEIAVLLLTGPEIDTHDAARAANTDGFLRTPFRPLELLTHAERPLEQPKQTRATRNGSPPAEQLQLYAHDLGQLLESERRRPALLEQADRQTIAALTTILESKDPETSAHSHRALRYATELTRAIDASLLQHPQLEYGFLLHDLGKLGIPDQILRKPGPLTPSERSLLKNHALLGEQILSRLPLLAGHGIQVVRSHHERWDGNGYPDRLAGNTIPLGARIFAVADALDAMTSDRPYRHALSWDHALTEITTQSAGQFDPEIVHTLTQHEPSLRRIYYELRSMTAQPPKKRSPDRRHLTRRPAPLTTQDPPACRHVAPRPAPRTGRLSPKDKRAKQPLTTP
jgi:response regulator RpfG family c-di-GMP phosphodiesterase